MVPLHLSARDLTSVYQAAERLVLPALGPVSFTLEPGSFTCLVGPSGCGKTTLIRLLAGLQTPTAGQIMVDGVRLRAPSRRVGVMFQDASLLPWRTVTDNIALPLELAGVDRTEGRQKALALLPRLGLDAHFANSYPGELSGGMAQRVALGRVLIQQPDALLLDEPFGALDALTRERMVLDLMQVWSAEGQTVLMVTHNIHEAILLADRILVLSNRPGQLAADIPVHFPRPRRVEDVYHESYGAIARQVREMIGVVL